MIAEHSFVTTLEEPAAMQEAAAFLDRIGLRSAAQTIQDKAQSRRRRRAFRGLPQDFVPREVKLEFDRGRMHTAVAIRPKGKPRPIHHHLLLAIVTGLEHLLVDRVPVEQAAQPWDAIVDEERARIRRHRMTLGIIFLAFFSLMAVVICLA